ncbi:hypothetical protein [Aromatoleum anaerobium]|uniref:Uncharacterized protein n=1 Tax=Aromatoleum anaerobium TaxID=182180 RepID=A0ABX1PPU2_9RHOO|nr:hypothetical protein [Aromatoleum anaerobium]MCK0507925.1 hypothetical protein [Aromatoleum anaerobium]
MVIDDIRAAIAADSALRALIPDTQAIAAALSVGRTRPNGREIGNGTVLETVGLVSGNRLLDVIDTEPSYRHVKPLLEQGRLVASSPVVVAALQSMVPLVLSQAEANALIALGRDPDPVAEIDVRRALWNDDGSLAL